MVERVLEACAGAGRTVVVGPRRGTGQAVVWAREEPPGGGPLAALAAGVRAVTAETVVVFAADLPFVTREVMEGLLAELDPAAEGVVLTDPGGRDQPLAAAYRTEALRRELALIAAEHGGVAGLPLRLLTAELVLRRLPDPTGEASFDCDTWEDLSTARARIREHGHVLDEWIAAAKADLGIDLDVDVAVLLDLARDAAHAVTRPAAPLTAFLVGYAAARAGGGPEAVAEAARKATALAERWAAEAAEAAEAEEAAESEEGEEEGK
jgi:molybdopterin-guanine dinucleotide biosynthesis protein A